MRRGRVEIRPGREVADQHLPGRRARRRVRIGHGVVGPERVAGLGQQHVEIARHAVAGEHVGRLPAEHVLEQGGRRGCGSPFGKPFLQRREDTAVAGGHYAVPLQSRRGDQDARGLNVAEPFGVRI